MSDIFDTSDVSDLPEAVATRVMEPRGRWGNGHNSMYLSLFQLAGRPLTNRQVIAGMYRKFGREISSQTAANTLHMMKKRGLLVSVGRGTYDLTPEAKAAE